MDPRIDEAMARLDTETTALGEYVESLKLKTGATEEQIVAHNAALGAVADRLKGMHPTPDAPIPDPPIEEFVRQNRNR